jgi:hypothetical protein
MTFRQRVKCFLGYHEWKDTGIRRMYGFVYLIECTHCKTLHEMTLPQIEFVTVDGQECMVIKRD